MFTPRYDGELRMLLECCGVWAKTNDARRSCADGGTEWGVGAHGNERKPITLRTGRETEVSTWLIFSIVRIYSLYISPSRGSPPSSIQQNATFHQAYRTRCMSGSTQLIFATCLLLDNILHTVMSTQWFLMLPLLLYAQEEPTHIFEDLNKNSFTQGRSLAPQHDGAYQTKTNTISWRH